MFYFSQSSQLIRVDVSIILSRENTSHQSTPVSIDINEDNQLRCNLEQQKSSTANPIQPPAILPRPTRRPTLFLQPSTAPQINFERVLGAHQNQQNCKTWKSVSENKILQELITTFTIFSQKPMIHLSLTEQLIILNMSLSTLITIQACHTSVSTQPRSLSTTVKQMRTI